MPIIPVVTPDMPDYTPPRMPVPDISTNPNMIRAKTAAEAGQLVAPAEDIYVQQRETQGQIQANRDIIKYGADLEAAKKKVLDAPLKPYPGIENQTVQDPDSGEGGQSYEYNTLGFQPKWMTIQDDYKKEVDRINKEYDARQDPYTRRYFQARATRVQAAGFKSIADAQSTLYDNAQLSAWRTTMDDIHQRMYSFPPQLATWSASRIPSFKIADNQVYAEQKALINKTADTFLAQGMKPTAVEPLREKELKKLDMDTARAAMDANPDAWLLANENGTNEWQQKMDEASRDKLEEKALAKSSRMRTEENRILADLKKADEESLGQALNTRTLSRPLIASKKYLQGTQAVWYAHLEQQEKGVGDDVSTVVDPLRIKALSFRPPAETQSELDSALINHQMSSPTHQVLSEAVTRSREREQRISIDQNVRSMGRSSHELQMALFPPAVQSLEKPDYANNYSHALDEYNAQILSQGEGAAPKIAHEIKQKYLARNQDLAENNLQAANTRLGAYAIKVDANGVVDKASVQEAAKSAYARYHLETPEKVAAAKRNGTYPRELDNELQMIQDVIDAAKLKSLWKDQSRTTKEGGKPQ